MIGGGNSPSVRLATKMLAFSPVTGSMAPGPRSSSTGSLNPNLPFPSSPDPPPSQNPLSLMMSQMSKYAMPSSTPLYHNAIKTIATSDDELLPDRPMLPPGRFPGSGPGAGTWDGKDFPAASASSVLRCDGA